MNDRTNSTLGNAEVPENQSGFTLRPGDGWMFMQAANAGVFVWQGHIAITDDRQLQIQGQLDTTVENPHWDIRLREFGTWHEVAQFALPMLGNQSYVEGTVSIPLAKPLEGEGMRITHRKLTVRMFKGETREGETVLRFRLPQIERPGKRMHASGQNVPL